MKKNKASIAVLAGFSSLFLLGCYSATSSSLEEEASSTSEQVKSSESLTSSESFSSSSSSSIYDGFTLIGVERVPFYESSDSLKYAYLFQYSISEHLSSFFIEFEFNGGSKRTVEGEVWYRENNSSDCWASLLPDDYYGQTYKSMTKATPYGFLA